MFQRIHNRRFLFLWTYTRLSGAGMGIVVVFMLPNPQLFPNLSDIGRMDFEAVLFLDILLNIIVGVDSAHIGFQILGVDRNVKVIADLFPT